MVFDPFPLGNLDTEDAVKAADFLCIKGHGFRVVRMKHIDGDVTLHKLQSSFLWQRQHTGVGVTIDVHALHGNDRVGHIAVIRGLDGFRLLSGDPRYLAVYIIEHAAHVIHDGADEHFFQPFGKFLPYQIQ